MPILGSLCRLAASFNNPPKFDGHSFDIEFGVGNFNQRSLALVANVPVSKKLSLRFSGSVRKHDAFTSLLDNYLGLGPHYHAKENDLQSFDRAVDFGQAGLETEDRSAWRLSAMWRPSNEMDVYLSAERYRDNGTGVAELDPTLVEQGIRAVVLDSVPFIDLTNDVVRTKIDYRFLDGITASYIYGGSNMQRAQLHDTDHGRTGDFEIERTDSSEFDFYSHELSFRNADDKRLRWITGIFASRESNSIVFAVDQQNEGGSRVLNSEPSWISGEPGAAVAYAVQPERRSESLGIYSQLSYDLNEISRITIGARYNRDTKSDIDGRAINCRVPSIYGPYFVANAIGAGAPRADQIYVDPFAQQAIDAGQFYDNGTNIGIADQPCWVRQVNDNSATWSNTSGLLRYDFNINQDVLLYGSMASGFKAGHIQDAGNTAEPETVISYELGIKSQFFDDTLRINAALFHADYDDLQFSDDDRIDTNGDGVPDSGGSTIVRNASEARVRGFEIEALWALSKHDLLQVTATVMDAHFGQFDIPDSLFGNLFNPFVNADERTSMDDVNLAGNSPPRTPDWKLSMSYRHDIEIAPGFLQLGGTATLSDKYFLDIYNRDSLSAGVFESLPNGGENLGVQSAYTLLGLHAKFENKKKTWTFEAYVKNLTNEDVKLSSGNFITENGFTANYLPPRTYGLILKYSM